MQVIMLSLVCQWVSGIEQNTESELDDKYTLIDDNHLEPVP